MLTDFQLTLRLFNEFNAEAVCVISNQKLTEKLVYGMNSCPNFLLKFIFYSLGLMSRGIPAFGPIWDS